MIVNVSNKVVVITGGSRGIGSSLARAFAKERAKVVINYCSSDKEAKNLFDEISEYNKNCMIIKADVTVLPEVMNMYRQVVERYNGVDLLVNNAGIIEDALIQTMSPDQWQKVLDVNLTGTFLCCREFVKIMLKQKGGKIINIASLKGQEGSEGQVNYAASKAGVIALTKTLAQELGKYGVSVNAVCPGFIVTDLNRHDERKRAVAISGSLLSIDNMINSLVDFLIFMASDQFDGISGRVFNLDSRLL